MKKRKGRQAIAVLLGGIMLCSLSMGAVSTPVHEAEEEAQAAQDTGGGGYNEAPALLDAAEDQGDGSGLLEQDLPQDEAEAGGLEIPAMLPQEEEDAGEADLPEQEGSDAGSEESIVEESLQEARTPLRLLLRLILTMISLEAITKMFWIRKIRSRTAGQHIRGPIRSVCSLMTLL